MADKSSSSWWKWLLAFLVIAGAGGGFYYFHHKRTAPVTYTTTAVTRSGLTKEITATGTLNPVVNVTVGSQVSGRISKLNVDFNSMVKSNEVIAEIDPATYQAAVDQAEADLANSEANLELQEVECRRSSDLFTNKLVSQEDYDTSLANLHEAEATVKIKQASLSNAVVNLDYCKIVSPVDGVVILRAVELGQTVASSFSTPTIFQIANDLTRMQIDSSVAEADVGGVTEGQSVDFTVDAYPERTFHGSVTQVRNSPTTVNNVVTYDCVIAVTNSDYKLKPGMTADVAITVSHRDNVLVIPNGALRFHPPDGVAVETNTPSAEVMGTNSIVKNTTRTGGHHSAHSHGDRLTIHTIYVLTGEDDAPVLQAVQVRTGISDGISTEIISGLDEGAKVVTSAVVAGDNSSSNSFGRGFRMH